MRNFGLDGHLGADSELIEGKNGKFLSFRMANDDRLKNGDNKTDWFRVTMNGDRAVKLAEYLKKGKYVFVTGYLSVSTYQAKDGSTQVSMDISATSIDFANAGSGQTKSDTEAITKTTEAPVSTGKLKKSKVVETADEEVKDDLPF